MSAGEYERLKSRMNLSVPEGCYAPFLSGQGRGSRSDCTSYDSLPLAIALHGCESNRDWATRSSSGLALRNDHVVLTAFPEWPPKDACGEIAFAFSAGR